MRPGDGLKSQDLPRQAIVSVLYQAGARVHTAEATYTLPDEAAATQALEAFRDAESSQNPETAALRRYNAHLEAMLAGASYRPVNPIEAVSDEVLELPRPRRKRA